MMRGESLCLWAALVLFPVLAPSCSSHPTPKAQPPVVRVDIPRAPAADLSSRYSGVVRPSKQVQLDFKVGGYVDRITRPAAVKDRVLQEGDSVEEGQVLALIRPSDYRAQLDLAQAAVLEARAAESQANRDRARSQLLVEANARPAAELEALTAQSEVASARRARAEAAVRQAQLQLGDCSLRAPWSGTIMARLVEEGALVGPGRPGFALADLRTVKIGIGVPDSVSTLLKTGDTAEVEVTSLGIRAHGTITRIAPAADATSRVFDIEVSVPNPDGRIKAGVAATVLLAMGADRPEAGRVVPLGALVRRPDSRAGVAVFCVEESAGHSLARIRPVDVLSVVGNGALVSGLPDQSQVVTLGAPLLHDGEPVRIVP